MRLRPGLIAIAIILSSLFSEFPPANAANPTFVQSNNQVGTTDCATCTQFGLAYQNNVAINDILVAIIICQDPSNAATTGISDAAGNTWTQANSTNGFAQQNGGGTLFTRINIWTATAKSSRADSATFNCTNTMNFIWGILLEFSGMAIGSVISERSGDTTGTSFSTTAAGSASFTTPAILIGGIACSGCGTFTVGSGFTLISSCYPACNNSQGNSEYAVSGVSSPTAFPATGTNSVWADFGIAIMSSGACPAGGCTVVVIPCTYAQIQCWWYPMLFYGVFGGSFLIIGKAGGADPRGLTFLLLAGLTYCSLIQVQMNMTNIAMPVILSITGIVYAVRGR